MTQPRPVHHFDHFDPVILETDFAPDEKMAKSLGTTMEGQAEEMEQLDVQISRLEARLSELKTRKASVHRSYGLNQALLAPTRKLPPETLGEVFLHTISDPARPYSFGEAPLLLLQVCRRWRRIASGTPRLWTQLKFGDIVTVDPCPIIELWLSNSGTLPIDITIRPRKWSIKGMRREAARLVIENFHRFRSFQGELDLQLWEEHYRQMDPIRAPLLEHFETLGAGIPVAAIGSLRGCIQAPKLTSFSLDHSSIMDLVSFDSASLRNVTLDHPALPAETRPSLNFLNSCSNIFCLSITFCEGMQPIPSDGRSRIILPRLETLIVKFWSWDDPSPFLDVIEVPALQDLEIEPMDQLDEGSLPLFETTLDSLLGQKPPLRRLHLVEIKPIDSTTFVAILKKLQDLRVLELQWCYVDDAILDALTVDPSSPPSSWICPYLSTLDVFDTTLSGDLFVKLVRSRAPINGAVAPSGGAYLSHVDAQTSPNTEREGYLASLVEIANCCAGLLEVF